MIVVCRSEWFILLIKQYNSAQYKLFGSDQIEMKEEFNLIEMKKETTKSKKIVQIMDRENKTKKNDAPY